MKQTILILIGMTTIFGGCNTANVHLYDFSSIRETDNSFIISPSATIFFSQNYDDHYQIVSYNILTRKFYNPSQIRSNNKSPFFFNNNIYYLTEIQKNEGNYTLNDEKLRSIVGNKPIDEIISSKGGTTILIKFKNNDSLFILKPNDLSLKFIKVIEERLNTAAISDEYNTLVISSGDRLLCISLQDFSMFEIGKNWNCKKLNPFIYNDKVYFASYGLSNNYKIFSASIKNSSEPPLLEFQSNGYDLRLPKKTKQLFFFIEVQNSNYLLKYFDTTTKQITTINTAGVVYSYEFYNDQVFYVYSDFVTPRGLRSFDLKTKKTTDLTCKELQLKLAMNMISKDDGEPPAYTFSTLEGETSKGTVLYFHPGRTAHDFSPRWDNMVLPFCLNGYTMLCPNFPMSTGYGKAYETQSFDSSVNYMAKWVEYIHAKHPKRPIYLYGSSSGCVLMEACLLKVSDKVTGVISAFGLSYSSYLPPNIPVCFVLGKKDQIVPYKQRSKVLKQISNKVNVTMVPLDEGHWIQHPKNFVRYYEEILSFMAESP